MLFALVLLLLSLPLPPLPPPALVGFKLDDDCDECITALRCSADADDDVGIATELPDDEFRGIADAFGLFCSLEFEFELELLRLGPDDPKLHKTKDILRA